jgi:hypothetical protein
MPMYARDLVVVVALARGASSLPKASLMPLPAPDS